MAQAEVPSEVVREGYQPGDAVEIIGGKYYSATKTRYATVVTESEWMVKVRLNWVNAGEVRTPTLMKGNLKRVVTLDEEEESVSVSESSAGTDSVTLGLDDVAGVARHAVRRTGGEGGRLLPSVELAILTLAKSAVKGGIRPERVCEELREAMMRFRMEMEG